MAGERRLPGLGLWGFWNQGSNTWKPGTDENNRRLSAFVQGAVASRTAASPANPADGTIWIVPTTANAEQNKVAVRDNGATVFLDPFAGLRLFVRDTGTFAYFDGTMWKDEEAGEVFTFTGLSDTPDAFGSPGQVLAVNSDGSELIFVDPSTGGGGDGPAELPPITNNAGKVLAVNADATSVEWIDPPSGGGEPSKAHRYWRALFTKPNPAGGRNDYASVAEFEWRQAVGGPQTASVAGAIASGSYTTAVAAGYAYDGNTATYWESQSGTQTGGTIWLGHDFGSPVEIAEVMVRKSTQYPDENPFGIAIQHSDDKTAWTTAHTFETGFTATDSGTAMTSALPGYEPPPDYVLEAPKDGKAYARKDGAWAEASSGGGSESFIGAPLGTPYGLTGTFSSTTMPTKGLVFAPTKNVRINAVLALLDGYDANTDSYHAQIVELNSDNSVKAVLATSASVVPNTANPTSVRFALTTAVVIAAGKRYGFNLVREPVGRNQTTCPVLVSFFWGVSFSGSIEYAVLNYAVVDPPVGSAATVTANSIPNIWFEGAQA